MKKFLRSKLDIKAFSIWTGFLLLVFFVIAGFLLTASFKDISLFDNSATLKQSAKNISEICTNEDDWRNCYGKQLGNLNYGVNLKETLGVMNEIMSLDEKTRDCHLIAHWIAISEVEKSPREWVNVFDFIDQTTCNNGYIHGVMEGRSRFDPDLKLDGATIVETCDLIDKKTSSRLGVAGGGSDDACGHIIGHILLAENSANITETVKICSGLPDKLRISCFQGVFMENVTRENLEIHGVAKKFVFDEATAKELGVTCSGYEGDVSKNCWRELSHIFTVLAKNNPLKSYEYCYREENKDFAYECYLHSINLIILTPGYSETDLKNTCSVYSGDPKLMSSCISRALGSLLNSSLDFINRAHMFCLNVDDRSKDRCYRILGDILRKKADNSQRAKLCKNLPEIYKKYCFE